MMTSAGDTVSSAADPFAQGAGFINPNGAADPGLVYPTTATEYRQYLVGLGVQFAPPNDTLTPISGPELNQASIAIGSLVGSQTVHRHVRNVGSTPTTYTASTTLPGFTVTVNPPTMTLAAGETGELHRHVLPDRRRLRRLGQGFTDLDWWRAQGALADRHPTGPGRGAGGGARRSERQWLGQLQRDPRLHGPPLDDGLRPRRGDPDRG